MSHSSGQIETVKQRVSYKWSISNFSHCIFEPGDFLDSSVFPLQQSDEKWCLKMFPGGADGASNNFISLFLKLVSSHQKEVNATYKFTIKNVKNKKVSALTCEDTQTFVQGGPQEHGFKQFIECKYLFKNSRRFLPNDILTVSCEIATLTTQTEPVEVVPIDHDLFNHFGELFESQKFTDVTFCIEGRELKAHKAFLASRNEVFRAMFETGMKESLTNNVEITDIKYDIFEAMLQFIYADKAPNSNTAKELLMAADKYGLDRLKVLCEEEVFSNITTENATEVFYLADLHNCPQLKSKTLQFVVANFLIVMETAEWKDLVKTNPTLANEAHTELWKNKFLI